MNQQFIASVEREALDDIAHDIIAMVLAKNHDYGDAWQKHGVAGVLVRLSDKSLRLERLEDREALVVDEKVEDTLRDICGYALLGLLRIEQERHPPPPTLSGVLITDVTPDPALTAASELPDGRPESQSGAG